MLFLYIYILSHSYSRILKRFLFFSIFAGIRVHGAIHRVKSLVITDWNRKRG